MSLKRLQLSAANRRLARIERMLNSEDANASGNPMSKIMDYLVDGGGKIAELEATIEHMGGALGREIELHEQTRAEIERLRAGIHRYLSGDWMQKPPSKLDKCPHDHFGWEDCGACIDAYFVDLLGPEPSRDGQSEQK